MSKENHTPSASGLGPKRQGKPRVLLAEDDRELRRMLAEEFSKEGLDVIEMEDGAGFMEFMTMAVFSGLPYRPPDVIVSDIRMPGYTGLEVLEGVRRRDWITPVVLITAFPDDEIKQEALRLGASIVFEKPFDLRDVREAVKFLADSR